MNRFIQVALATSVLGALAAPLTGCNAFSAFDHPTSDPQLISAARACMDRGDYQCAADNYAKVSSAEADTAASEGAFNTLAQSGITMSDFMASFFSSDPTQGFTILANLIAQSGASATVRANIFAAYQKGLTISEPHLKGLVRFVTATVLVAELLAEDGDSSGYAGTDLALDPTSCKGGQPNSCVTGHTCDRPSGKKLQLGTAIGTNNDLQTATAAQMTGAPTFHMLNAALSEVVNGLSDAIPGSSGNGKKASDTAGGVLNNSLLNTALNAGAATDQAACYRMILISAGIGV